MSRESVAAEPGSRRKQAPTKRRPRRRCTCAQPDPRPHDLIPVLVCVRCDGALAGPPGAEGTPAPSSRGAGVLLVVLALALSGCLAPCHPRCLGSGQAYLERDPGHRVLVTNAACLGPGIDYERLRAALDAGDPAPGLVLVFRPGPSRLTASGLAEVDCGREEDATWLAVEHRERGGG